MEHVNRVLIPALMIGLVVSLLAGCNEDDIERSLGKQTSTAVEKEFGVNKDPVLAEWVDTLGHRLVGQSKRQNITYRFRVVNSDMVNAFAAPWGYVYVTQGMLNFATSEDELAFVMAHEVGHVANRDSIKSFKKSILFNIGVALLGRQSETLGNIGGIGAGLLMLHYSRDDERDSDVAGSTFAYAAGYDPEGGIAFFNRLMKEVEKNHPSSIEHIFLTHPPTSDRITSTQKRPELNLQDPAVASRIGRSYARRYAYATACNFYKMALDQKPDATQTRLGYADALSAQGLRDRAQTEYRAVLQSDAGNLHAVAALAALQTPRSYTVTTPDERQQSPEVLALAQTVQNDAANLATASHNYANAAQAPTTGISNVARSSISGMLDLGNQQGELSDPGQQAFLRANAAVSSANDTAFTLEAVNTAIVKASDLVRSTSNGLRTAVEQVAAGQATAGDLAVYRRALTESQLAEAQLQQAMADATAAQPLVLAAARSARDTMQYANMMINQRDGSRYIYSVKVSAGETQRKAAAAFEAVRQIKWATTAAEARALLAKLNLAALGASPEMRDAYDGMTAYYCHVSPREVAALRKRGLGFGDAAFVLIAARTREVPPDTFQNLVHSNRVIDGLRKQGFLMLGPVSLLRFLNNAVDREAEARQKI